eukprot:scaffold1363_cov356-Prasinococcus_capsulatus_cf.AAC.4
MYGKELCRTAGCRLAWQTALQGVESFLPVTEVAESYKTCAIVSSSKWLPEGAGPPDVSHAKKVGRGCLHTSALACFLGLAQRKRTRKRSQERREAAADEVNESESVHVPAGGCGIEIDEHEAVFRIDNAPVQGYDRWVGNRTTHRFVSGAYSRLVQTMIGTEVVEVSSRFYHGLCDVSGLERVWPHAKPFHDRRTMRNG